MPVEMIHHTFKHSRVPLMVDRVVIPSDAECDRCTLSWRWDAYSEPIVFTSCADVSVSSQKAALATVQAHCERTGAFLK